MLQQSSAFFESNISNSNPILKKMPMSLMSSCTTDFRKEDISVGNSILPSSSPSRLIQLARKFNNFYLEGLNNKDFKPLVCQGHQIGLVAKNVENELLTFPQVFYIHPDQIEICPDLTDYEDITNKIENVLTSLRCQDKFSTLKGWRNERYEIRPRFGSPALFAMERAATPLFGLLQYGVDLNGYVKDQNGNISLWISKRSQTKQTWPGCFDNFVAGGLSVGLSVKETAIKESQEEANLPKNIAENVEAAGSISIFFQSERGLFPNTEFVYDIELPLDFVPSNNDGEVERFELMPASRVLDLICDPQFKTTSAPVTIDFLIRKGIITIDTEPDLPELIEMLHIPIHMIYRN